MAIDYWWVYQLASTTSMDTNFLNSKPPISTSHDSDLLKEACKTRAPVPQRFPSRGAIPSGFPSQIKSEHPPFFCRTHIPSHPAWQTSQSAVSLKMATHRYQHLLINLDSRPSKYPDKNQETVRNLWGKTSNLWLPSGKLTWLSEITLVSYS